MSSREGPVPPSVGWSSSGQSTVEYALALGAFLAMVLCLALLVRAVQGGVVGESIVRSASHSQGQGTLGAVQDALMF